MSKFMNVDFASTLDDCIERLARGETLQACLSRYPEQAVELEPYLRTATRIETSAKQIHPSPAFKARGRARLTAHMAAHPRALKIRVPGRFRFPWLVLGLAICLVALAVTTTVLAQSALPGGTLYPLKLSSEQAWQMVSPDPAGVGLVLAQRRVDEALAVSGDAKAQGIALQGYQSIVTNLQKYQDPSVQQRIKTTLKTQQAALTSAGLIASSPVHQTETPDSTTPNTPHAAGGIKNPEKNPTATPVFRLPDIFGH